MIPLFVALVVAALFGAVIALYGRGHQPLVVIGSDVPVPRATASPSALRRQRRRLERERRANNPSFRSHR